MDGNSELTVEEVEPVCCSKGEMYLNVGLQAFAYLLAALALLKRPRRFLVWLIGMIVNFTALRMNTCMNCVYYGKDCHLGWGLITARMFQRTKEPDPELFRKRFPINFGALMFVLLYPIPEMRHNRMLLVPYIATLMAMNLAIPFACRKCGMNDVCPMGERVVNSFEAFGR